MTLKRSAKAVRNLFKDPLPRSHVLTLAGIRIDGPSVHFDYGAKGRRYVITMGLPEALSQRLDTTRPAMMQLLTAIGIAFSAFFFRLSDFATLSVQTAPLDEGSLRFFEEFLVGGLGEFRFRQGLDPSRRVQVVAAPDAEVPVPLSFDAEDRVLMLNGGGKDTVVAAEILKAAGQAFTWVTIRPNAVRRKVIELSGVRESIEVTYLLDGRINGDRVYAWGHIPHTSIVLSLGLLIAVLTGSRYVAAGNERSADSGNVMHRGMEINHQYTKSSAFEEGFRSFARRRVTTSVDVFSILRPFHDLQLAQRFAAHKHYHGAFVSCNRGIGRGLWCKACAKCAFTALALGGFLDDADLQRIFGDDILKSAGIRKLILDLVNGAIKPWECVGTREECVLALALLLDRRPDMDFDAFPRRRDLERATDRAAVGALRATILESTSPRHAIPSGLLEKLGGGLRGA